MLAAECECRRLNKHKKAAPFEDAAFLMNCILEDYLPSLASFSLRAARAEMSPRVVFSIGVLITGASSATFAFLAAFLASAFSARASSSKMRL